MPVPLPEMRLSVTVAVEPSARETPVSLGSAAEPAAFVPM